MKPLLIALCILASTSAFTLVACSKRDVLPKDGTTTITIRTNPAARPDTPYGKIIRTLHAASPANFAQPEVIILPAATRDTPYGSHSLQAPDGHSIK